MNQVNKLIAFGAGTVSEQSIFFAIPVLDLRSDFHENENFLRCTCVNYTCFFKP